ncbi:MAG: hypothetical protein ABIK09_01235 [Pseudomonadota bacterium]
MTGRPVALLLALTLVACSAPAPVAGPGPGAQVVTLDLGNRSDVTCDVYRGRALLATIPSGEWVSVPNLPGPRVALSARCGKDRFDAEVDLDGDGPRWVVGTAQRPMPPAPARIRLLNRTSQDYDLHSATGRLGSLLGGAERHMGGVAPGALRIRLVEREGRGSWELPVEAASGAWTQVEVDPPRGRLVLQNDSPEPARIRVGERLERRLSPGERVALDDLSPGAWRIEAHLLQSQRIVAAAVTVVAGGEAVWSVSRESAAVEVRNLTDEPVAVTIRGETVGRIEPGTGLSVRDLSTGVAELVATGEKTGVHMQKSETLVPGATHLWELSTGAGLLTLLNAFSDEAEVYLDGVRSLALGPAGEVTLSLPAGEHDVGWSSALTESSGHVQVEISSAHAQRVSLGPGSARVAVTNRLDSPVALYLGGRFQARVATGERVTLCGLMAGSQLLEAIEEGDLRRVHRRKMDLRSEAWAAWEILPRTFTLVVTNATGEDLRPLGDLKSLVPELQGGETARLAAPVGALRCVFAGKRTGVLYQHEVRGVEGAEHKWTVPLPVGTLVVTNSAGREVTLFEAEREVARLAVDGRVVLDALTPGHHSLRARAEGLLLGIKDFLVLPGSEFLWDLRPAYGRVRVVNRTDGDVLLFQDDQPTGGLYAGAETTLEDMPLAPVALRAVLPASGTARAIRITPSAESPPTWFIESDAGQLEVRGLEGHGGELRPDQGTPLRFDGDRDRVFLPLAPGWHDVRILLEDGGEPDVRRVRVFAGQTTAITLGGTRFSLEVVNSLEGALQVELDGRVLATVSGGATERLAGLEPGVRRFLARRKSGGAEIWLLREVIFEGGRTYRWTVPLEPGDGEDPR